MNENMMPTITSSTLFNICSLSKIYPCDLQHAQLLLTYTLADTIADGS